MAMSHGLQVLHGPSDTTPLASSPPPSRESGTAGMDTGDTMRSTASRQRRKYLRRRIAVISTLVVAVFVLGIAVGRVGAAAELSRSTTSHDVIAPGETLWDVAARTAPPGIDTRRHLADIRRVNGLDTSNVDAWTVVAIPAR